MLFYIAIYFIASNLDNMQILYFVLIGLPISANIIYDIWLKQQAELNSTLAKSSLFQIVNMLLFLLGILGSNLTFEDISEQSDLMIGPL